MALSLSSALFYWSARYGEIPVVGGYPTLTRNTAAKIGDRSGKLISATPNTPRFGWDTINSEKRQTLLLEMGRTNSCQYSEDLTNVAWVKTASSVVANQVNAPDGALTGGKFKCDGANAEHYVDATFAAPTASTKQSMSIFARAAEKTWIHISVVNKAGTISRTWFNLSTGTIGTSDASHTARITAYGDEWYRCEVTVDSGSGGTVFRFVVGLANGDNTLAWAGDGTSGVYLWGGQFEKDSPCVSSYEANASGATSSRSADAFSWNYSKAPQAAMIYLRFIEMGGSVGSGRVFQIGSVGNTAPALLIYSGGSTYRLQHANGSLTPESNLGVAPSIGDIVELLSILYSDGSVELVQSINGGGVTTGGRSTAAALAAAWSGPTFNLNSVAATAVGANRYAEVKAGKYANVDASSAQGRMDEFRMWEYDAQGNAL